jgi:GT2 family glycosyltransferase
MTLLARVDIIILEWNRPDDTIAAIGSALAQTGVERKVWVVDQASSRENRAKLRAFCQDEPDVFVLWLERNVGVAAGRNLATWLGDAPIVVALDNDAVFCDAECVSRAVTRLQTEPLLGALAFRVLDRDTGQEQYWDYPELYRGTQLDSFEVTRYLGGGHALRRAVFERVGGYDESLFFAGEERDLSWRMIRAGYRLRWCRDLAILHRPTAAAKLTWSDRRYYYSVRNTLYVNHKFGAGCLGFLRGAASFFIRGVRNRLGWTALLGVAAACAMSLRFAWTTRDKRTYRLTPELRRYIRETDAQQHESALAKLRRQFSALPKL